MRVKLHSNGHEYYGIATEIVDAMRTESFNMHPRGSRADYLTSACATAHEWLGVELVVRGTGDDERCASFIEEMVERGLAEILD